MTLSRVAPVIGPLHGDYFETLFARAKALRPIKTAVAHPCDAASLGGALAARDRGLIAPILVGPRNKIEAAARAANISLEGVEVIEAPHSHASAEAAVALARQRRVEALMKGALHTDEIMGAVVNKESGLRTERRMSHVFALDVPTYAKPLFVSDAAINIAPTLDEKADIVKNAIDLAHALGVERPKVAILSAVETVDAKMPSTIDAAALCKMADRGQIAGADLDGPLAFDSAISPNSVATKNIVSKVAGAADILIAPDIEAGNLLAKQLVFLAGAKTAGLALGARVPIILTSRADDVPARVASCVLAQLYVHRPVESR
ncbi:MAG: bifunctional enoyl-CoA hydratase/phosphate acetyltransferase, partial [Methylocystis sp.]|nr:bifunctional enoyl-CoA hydratase/phosphate acetyltransferase [Methylocystis sp.]